jgi:hypothetical protein
MMALLAYLRERPWLGPCMMIMAVGFHAAVTSRFGYLGFWFGVLSVAGGLLIALGGYLGHRRERARHRENRQRARSSADHRT